MSNNTADRLTSRIFDKNFIPGPEQHILEIGDKKVGTLQNYFVYAGLPKAGKSTFISALLSSCFSSWAQFGQKISLPENRRKIALFDTESSTYDLARTMDRIKLYSEITNLPDRFTVFTMREDHPKDIQITIELYLQENPDCACIVIDGLLDLCINYNDEIETRLLTNWLKRVTKVYNCFIIAVLHLSKNAGETLGHLGSNTDRWAQGTVIIKKNKETSQIVLEAKFLRSSEEFDPIAIEWAGSGFIKTDYREIVHIKNPVGRPKKEK